MSKKSYFDASESLFCGHTMFFVQINAPQSVLIQYLIFDGNSVALKAFSPALCMLNIVEKCLQVSDEFLYCTQLPVYCGVCDSGSSIAIVQTARKGFAFAQNSPYNRF